ncbi:MAG: glycerophosphodiester phosphodiesterase [Rhodanobacter sp.]
MLASRSAAECAVPAAPLPREKPLAARVGVIGHRGAPAWQPEHTLASYARAIADGADFIEPDLVMSCDGVLMVRHENEIGGTTDVAERREFAARRATRHVDGVAVTGWFTEDFTLAELKTLRARERLPQWRSTAHDGRWPIVTLQEVIDFAAAESAACGRRIGLVPEIKHGTHFRALGLPMEDLLLATLAGHAYTRTATVEIQSFEIGNLRYLRDQIGAAHPNIRLLQLLDAPPAQPYDMAVAGGTLDYARMMTAEGLREVAGYADAIGPELRAIIPWNADGHLDPPTRLVSDAHAVGLEVHPWTFRPENAFLAPVFRHGDPQAANRAGLVAQIGAYLDAGIDAFFTDDSASGRQAVDARGRGSQGESSL